MISGRQDFLEVGDFVQNEAVDGPIWGANARQALRLPQPKSRSTATTDPDFSRNR